MRALQTNVSTVFQWSLQMQHTLFIPLATTKHLLIAKYEFFFFIITMHRYQIKYSLHRHLRHACRSNQIGQSRSKAYECYACDKRFAYRFLVSRHIRKVHHLTPDRSKIKTCSTFRWTQSDDTI